MGSPLFLAMLVHAALLSNAAAGTFGCVAFRNTLHCDGTGGQRDPSGDLPCHLTIPSGKSGFCECAEFGQESGAEQKWAEHYVVCEHAPFTCKSACLAVAPSRAPTEVPSTLVLPQCGTSSDGVAMALEGKLEVLHLLRSRWDANPAVHLAAVVAALSDVMNSVVPEACAIMETQIETSSAVSLIVTDGKDGGVVVFFKVVLAGHQAGLAAALAAQLNALIGGGKLDRELQRELAQRAQYDASSPLPQATGDVKALTASAAAGPPGAPTAQPRPGPGGGSGRGGEIIGEAASSFEIAFASTALGVLAPIVLLLLGGTALLTVMWRTRRRRQLQRWARRDAHAAVAAAGQRDGAAGGESEREMNTLPHRLALRRWGKGTALLEGLGIAASDDRYEGGDSGVLTDDSTDSSAEAHEALAREARGYYAERSEEERAENEASVEHTDWAHGKGSGSGSESDERWQRARAVEEETSVPRHRPR